jgi:hypothetical protein
VVAVSLGWPDRFFFHALRLARNVLERGAMKLLAPFLLLSCVPLTLLACGGSTQSAHATGGDASAPVDAGLDAPADTYVASTFDAPEEPTPMLDASTPTMLLYSGDGEGFYDDTWEWDGTSWTQLNVPQPDTADGGSLGRSMHAMAQLGDEVVLYGGTANPGQADLADTWTWNGIAWTQLHIAGPPARNGHAMATLGNKVVMYGGCSGPLTDTWTFDGTAWTQVATTGPNPGDFRCGSAMATVGNNVVLFGGVGADASTWLFDGTSWTQSTATGPGMRCFFAMGTLGGKAVMFGGEQDANTFLDDTWTFDGTTWTQLMIQGPAQRFHHAMAPLGGALVLFGGGGPAGGPVPWYGDTWTFDGTAWTMLSATGPVGRLVYTLASR